MQFNAERGKEDQGLLTVPADLAEGEAGGVTCRRWRGMTFIDFFRAPSEDIFVVKSIGQDFILLFPTGKLLQEIEP